MYIYNATGQLVTPSQFTSAMGVVSWLQMINLQLQCEWPVSDTCLIYNYNESGQLVTLDQFKTAMRVVS